LVGGLPRRPGKRPEGPVGGCHLPQPVAGPHLFPRHHPPGHTVLVGRDGQLPRRNLQGHAHAVSHRRGRTHAHRQRDRFGNLPLPRTLHAGRHHLPGHLPPHRRRHPPLRRLGAPKARDTHMNAPDMSAFPLRLEGPSVPMVSFRKVTKTYGSLVVLDSLDLDVNEGEMVTIIGPSGSGKTTVLRMLMTLESINDGVIYVEGEPLTHMP